MPSQERKRTVGRPQILTDSAQKKARSEKNKSYVHKTKIYLEITYHMM
jgi:hypothetical protein